MAVITRDKGVISGAAQPLIQSTAPVNGTSEQQTVTITGTPTGGTLTLSYRGYTTAAIPYNATAAAVVAALVALPSIGAGGVTGSGGALPGTAVVLTFAGNLAVTDVDQMTANGALLTGGTTPAVAVTTTTPGVNATHRNAPTGLIVTAGDTGIAYENKGAPPTPNWTQIGA